VVVKPNIAWEAGSERAAREAGATVAPGDGGRYFQSVAVDSTNPKQAAEHELILYSDVEVKVALVAGRPLRCRAEYESCAALARRVGVLVGDVIARGRVRFRALVHRSSRGPAPVPAFVAQDHQRQVV
jgi:hypothetical protein